jgi:endonuclease/exonuclease/phosphatase family metal-dependent hydrolase
MKRFISLALPALFSLFLYKNSDLRGETTPCPDIPLTSGAYAHDGVPDPDLTVVSLNMAKETRTDRILGDLSGATFSKTADVWLLQEAGDTVPEIARRLELDYIFAATDQPRDGTASGLAILSRYPIVDARRMPLPRYNLRFNTRCRIALSATVMRPSGPVRLFNVHLDTRITQSQRLNQVGAVLKAEPGSQNPDLPVIVGGDFNTANIRWVWNVVPLPYAQNHAAAMRHRFTEAGFDSPLDAKGKTFKLLGLPLHLDWIFSKRLKTISSGIEDIRFSDHNAVWVSLQH